jgi:hypothetical protein
MWSSFGESEFRCWNQLLPACWTPHNPRRRIDDHRRVRGQHCKSRCGRCRASRRTLPIRNGVMPACHAVPCIRPAVAPLLATAAAMRGRIRREYVSLGGLARKGVEHSACCRTFSPPSCRICSNRSKTLSPRRFPLRACATNSEARQDRASPAGRISRSRNDLQRLGCRREGNAGSQARRGLFYQLENLL